MSLKLRLLISRLQKSLISQRYRLDILDHIYTMCLYSSADVTLVNYECGNMTKIWEEENWSDKCLRWTVTSMHMK